jgi:hypothetical protein
MKCRAVANTKENIGELSLPGNLQKYVMHQSNQLYAHSEFIEGIVQKYVMN